ncbi:MAG: hypothetical protein ACI8UO_000650 [Verrucomicrobiales bacterium]|jgi:hypothetical protein
MTTGAIYAVIAYFSSIFLAALLGLVVTGGEFALVLKPLSWIAWVFAPGLFAPLGFFYGFSRERRLRRRAKSQADFEAQEEMLRKGEQRQQMNQTSTVRTLRPPKKADMSPEVREFLDQKKHVDTQGLTDFLRETRSHQLDELKKGLQGGDKAEA